MSKKRLRRSLRRLAKRKGIEYRDAVEKFYGKEISKLDKNLVWSLHSGKVRMDEELGIIKNLPPWMH